MFEDVVLISVTVEIIKILGSLNCSHLWQ
jgi:hypothetical protein